MNGIENFKKPYDLSFKLNDINFSIFKGFPFTMKYLSPISSSL